MSLYSNHITCTTDLQTQYERICQIIDKLYELSLSKSDTGVKVLEYNDGQTDTRQQFETMQDVQRSIDFFESRKVRIHRRLFGGRTKLIPAQNFT